MAAEITVDLEKPIALADRTIVAVTLRSPTVEELNEIGVLAERRNFEGGWWQHIHWDRLGELVAKCVVADDDAAWLGEVGFRDTYKFILTILGPLWPVNRSVRGAGAHADLAARDEVSPNNGAS